MSFFHTKSVAQLHADSENSNLSKDLGVMDLTFLGVGGIIGAGIFVLTGIAAAKYAGPAISISFALAGLLCILVGLAYSEFASMIPSSGSVYSYTFASLGEGMAFLTGWSLLLGYTVTGSAVAVGFSGYLAGILKSYGYIIPEVLLKTPAEGGIINLPAVIIILIIASCLKKFRENRFVDHAFYGLRPASAGLIAAAGFSVVMLALVREDAFKASGNILDLFSWKGLALAAVIWLLTNLVKKTKDLHPIVYIAASAVVGILVF